MPISIDFYKLQLQVTKGLSAGAAAAQCSLCNSTVAVAEQLFSVHYPAIIGQFATDSLTLTRLLHHFRAAHVPYFDGDKVFNPKGAR
jgi:hypothetical protein